ncbi:MAG: hypothetical protein ABL983_01105 [Nitrospira sp.]
MMMMLNLVKLIVWVLVLSSFPSYAQISHGGGGSGGETTQLVIFQNAATADGDGTAYVTRGYDILGLDIAITNTATVTIQGRSSSDGTYRNVVCYNRTTPTVSVTTTTSANFQCAVSGLLHVQVPISGCSSCTVTVKGYLTTAASMMGTSVFVDGFSVTLAGEDTVNDVQKVESRFTNLPSGATTSRVAADQLYKTGPGFVKGISCFSDATATAGSVVIRDNTAAGAGDILWSFDVLAVAYTTPFSVLLEVPFQTGLYLDFTTTTDLFCTMSYR